jgi:hypothetical protein
MVFYPATDDGNLEYSSCPVVGQNPVSGELIFAFPSTLFQLAMKKWKLALPELVAWAAAALLAKLLTYPWF